MPCNQRFARNSSTSDRVEEAMRRPKVEEGYDNDRMGDELGTYPDRPGEPDCLYYLRTGSCGYGSNCRLNHPSNAAAGQVYGLETNSEHPERAGQPNCGLLARQKSSRELTQSKSLLLTVVTHFGNIREKTEQPIERCCTVV